MKYRPEVDGLRAIAIIPVVLVHAGFGLFSGGFVGVDVFFVISGYLITTIILKGLERGHFSLIEFYERRTRRILPALFLVVGISSALAWFWMTPSQMAAYSGSVFSTVLFVSNMYFWRQSGYFDSPSEEKPLLHTWSLAVEEQYYLLFPLFLFLAWRLRKQNVFWVLIAITFSSFALSEWGWRHKPVASFFLAPTRAWEILVGSLLAFIISKYGLQKNNFLAFLGLSAICTSVFIFDEYTPFPSYYTLLPVLGTSLILCFGNQTITARLLTVKPMIFFGLISYSIYLWHQPIFAFARLQSVGTQNHQLFGLLCVITVFIAYLSWKYVEQPFRNPKFLSRGTIFASLVASVAIFTTFGYHGSKNGGFPERLSPEEIEYLNYFENSAPEWMLFERLNIIDLYKDECNFYDTPANRNGTATLIPRNIEPSCFNKADITANTLFLWGDSYAMSLNHGFAHHVGDHWNILQIASAGCAPDLVQDDNPFHYCERSNYTALQKITEIKPEVVVLKYNAAQDITRDHSSLKDTSLELLERGIKNVLVIGPLPHWNPTLPETLIRFWPNLPSRTYLGLQKEFAQLDAELKELLEPIDGVTYLSPIGILCNDQGCLTTVGKNHTDFITQWDDAHLSPNASLYLIGEALKLQNIKQLFEN